MQCPLIQPIFIYLDFKIYKLHLATVALYYPTHTVQHLYSIILLASMQSTCDNQEIQTTWYFFFFFFWLRNRPLETFLSITHSFFIFYNTTHFVVQTVKTKKYFIFYAGVGDNLIQSPLLYTYSPYSFNIVGNPCDTIPFLFVHILFFYAGRHRIRYLFQIPSHLFHTTGPTNIVYLSWTQSRMERERPQLSWVALDPEATIKTLHRF